METSQNFNILEVNTLKTNKLDYSYSNNILNITSNNCNLIELNHLHTDYYLFTKDNNMNINIKLNTQIIGTKYRLFITNQQKSLKITTINNNKFRGALIINNNSNLVNTDSIPNNLKKKIINTSHNQINIDSYDIIYIPNTNLGLYNGGYIDLVYIGNNNCNSPESNELGNWLVYGNLIGNINIPKNIITNTQMLLTIYLNIIKNKIVCVTTKNTENNQIYFNTIKNNHINLFLNTNYKINIIDINTNTKLYDSETFNSSNDIYNIKICNNLLTLNESNINETYISLKDINSGGNLLSFINGFTKNSGDTLNYNILPRFNVDILDYNKLNVIKYKIFKEETFILEGFFNINDIQSYNNNIDNSINLPNLLIGQYNIFNEKENNINSDVNNIFY